MQRLAVMAIKMAMNNKVMADLPFNRFSKSIEIINESSLDIPSITSTTDAFTVNADDRKYIQISKQILQYEVQRKRINFSTKSEHPRLENDETALAAPITSDWRLILQDSITTDDLEQGCLSLFDQINSALFLSPTEINHAIRFLQYVNMHMEHRRQPNNNLLEILFWNTQDYYTTLMSSLINLLSLPSDTLRTAALAFFDVGLRFTSSTDFRMEIVATELLPQLFLVLKPHEIPLVDTTMEFHRHLTSIVDRFFSFASPTDIRRALKDKTRASEVIEPLYESFCSYLQYLIDAPVSPPDHRSGFTFLFNMTQFSSRRIDQYCRSSSPTVKHFFREVRQKLLNDLESLFGRAPVSKVKAFIQFGALDSSAIRSLVKAFEHLLGRVSEGTKISNLAVNVVESFLSSFTRTFRLCFWSNGTFCLTRNNTIVSSSKLNSNALRTLFTPAQPHHATAALTAFNEFINHVNNVVDRNSVWKGWFPNFINAVHPSKLPFTPEFSKLHTELINLLGRRFMMIRDFGYGWGKEIPDALRRGVDELHHEFFSQTKDYIVHLSLHPFALGSVREDLILDYLRNDYLVPAKEGQARVCQEEVRREMDESALSSSHPPFILTSELIHLHTPDEIIRFVDRIVALLDSDSTLDDDTILRIFAFHRKSLSRVYLPDLFRTAGRSTEQYFHALESLLTLHVNCSPRAPIECLLFSRPNTHQPTFDEWDDVDLETGLILMRVINQSSISLASDSPQSNMLLLKFVLHCLPQICHSVARLLQPQHERLVFPSISILGTYFVQPSPSQKRSAEIRETAFIDVCKLCDERVIARCVSRAGFFSRLVANLLNHDFDASESLIRVIVDGGCYTSIEPEDRKTIRKTAPHFLEEGWQDALEAIFVQENFETYDTKVRTSRMMQFFGTNLVNVKRISKTIGGPLTAGMTI
ncbi:hypothetical protein BLNAU_13936 [Blattamonas nauphoetae]|uniref:Uncharacterized protein n=1 Tax=Blattamonas nauphoetae TaxID=2049346 RepID=A0ABQ9XIE4_9EUKA|nr:hypothetical protein BLNAU_13936 [Blattamonas nauphoetae]